MRMFGRFVRCAAVAAALVAVVAYSSAARAADSENLRVAKALSAAYAEVVDLVGPAVVGIETEKELEQDFEGPEELDMGDVFEQFFRFGPGAPRGFGDPRQRRESPRRRIPSLGSGVIIDADGRILTNNHVVENAVSIKVELAGEKGKSYKAEVVGTDRNSDIAVIRLIDPPANLPVAKLGDSDLMKPGNLVMAIGSPMGFKQSVSMGVVSAVGRTLGEFAYERFIQTDAAINQGNSGGPLLNLDGEVIGINTIISTDGRGSGSIGIGFAIPTSLAKPVIDQLIEKGAVTRGYIGIEMNVDDPDISRELGHDGTGVLVVRVRDDGPAAKAGIRPRDLIIELNHSAIRDNDHLRTMVAETRPGTVLPCVVLRDGVRVALEVTIEAQPADMFVSARSGRSAGPGQSTSEEESKDLGVSVQTLNESVRARYKISKDIEAGVVITKVDPASDAADKGLRPGVVITELNRTAITDVESFREALRAARGMEKVMLGIVYGDVARWIMVRLQD